MNQYQTLIYNIRNQKVKFYFILSVERSYSTTLQLALAQAPEIDKQINLPFNNYLGLHTSDNISVETVAKRINNVIEPLIQKHKQIHVLIHEHFECIACVELLNLLIQLSTDFICCIRNPKIQFLSYILVSMNDVFLHEESIHNNNLFSYQDLILLLQTLKYHTSDFDNVMNDIIHKKKVVIHDLNTIYRHLKSNDNHMNSISLQEMFHELLNLCKNNLRFSWTQTSYVLQHLKDYSDADTNIIAVDGGLFIQHPAPTLKHITEQLPDISFTPYMINHWHKFIKEDFTCCVSSDPAVGNNNLWNGESQHSTGIKSYKNTSNRVLDAVLLDSDFQLVLQNALNIYKEFENMLLTD